MEVEKSCLLCGKLASCSCRLCGKLVCDEHADKEKGICLSCKQGPSA